MQKPLPAHHFLIFGINSVVFRVKANLPPFFTFSKNRILYVLGEGYTFCVKVHKFQDKAKFLKALNSTRKTLLMWWGGLWFSLHYVLLD